MRRHPLPKVELSGREKRALLLWVLAGIAGLWYAERNFFAAFPEASVHFRVTRGEAAERARNFVESLGNRTADFRSVIVFGVDDNAKTYLEREAGGLAEANRLMSSEVNVWNWEVRFFKPQVEEEFQVSVSPGGAVTGYRHKVPEAQAGAEPGRDAARRTAENFLTAKLGKPAADWDFLPEEANSTKKPNRLDWSFTWEKHGFRAKDAPERLRIELHGSEIGEAVEGLKVPEQWARDYRHLRSTNEFYNTVAVIPYFLFLGAVLWIGIQLTRKGQTSWRLAFGLGILVAVLFTAMRLNAWPLEVSSYKTTDSYGSFAIYQIIGAIALGVVSALTVVIPLPGGEPLYRAAKPQFLRLRNVFTWRGVRSREFFSSTIVGLSLAAAHMGFLVAFYLIANHFGAWAPEEMKYDDSLNTAIPWIGGLAVGLLASTSEEFLFRLFAIPFLQKLTKSNVLAVVLPAFSWGFLHTAYPNEPPYIRGLEVGLIGVVAGIVMLRWGILATLLWHYTIDASLVGLFLVRSNSLYMQISGVVVGLAVLIPFGMAVFWRLRRGTFEEDADLLNQAPDVAEAPRAARPEPERLAAPTGALGRPALAFLLLCLVAGGLTAWKVKPVHLGDYLKLSVNAREAKVAADRLLKQRGVDPRGYHSATTFDDSTDAIVSEYLRQKLGVARLNEIYARRVPGALWDIRYFRDSQAEEYSVFLLPDGTLQGVEHKVAEAAEGASLAKDEAVRKAEAYLREEKRVDLAGWTLVDSTTEKRPKRLDHRLVWQENQPLDSPGGDPGAHAFARVTVSLVGDEVTNFRTFIKLPDEWRRKQEEQSVPRAVHSVLLGCFLVGLAAAALYFFLREIKSERMKELPWRRFAVWGLWGLVAYVGVIVAGDRIPAVLSHYNTAMPLKFLFGGLGVGFLIGAFFYMGAIALLFAMGWFFLKRAFGDAALPTWKGMSREYYRDALFIGIGGTGALLAVGRLTEWILARWPTAHRSSPALFGSDFDSLLPAVSIPATAMLHGLVFSGFIAVLCGLVLAHVHRPWVRALLFVLASLAMVSGWGTPADFLKQWIGRTVFLAVAVAGISRVVRMNLLGYFLVLAVPTLLLGAEELLSQPNAFYRHQGMASVGVLLALLAWPLAAWLFPRGARPAETAG
jgi:membrane protease YdiL (CAAX protease family)